MARAWPSATRCGHGRFVDVERGGRRCRRRCRRSPGIGGVGRRGFGIDREFDRKHRLVNVVFGRELGFVVLDVIDKEQFVGLRLFDDSLVACNLVRIMNVSGDVLERTGTWNGKALGVDVRVVVTAPAIETAREILTADLATLDVACSRFRPDSEIALIDRADGRRVEISPLLTEAIVVALDAADATDGDLDPTLGRVVSSMGYDRDFSSVPPDDPAPLVVVRQRTAWRTVEVDVAANRVRVPAGVQLDLGATAKAWAADRIAGRIHEAIGGAVLVSLGGDIAMAGDRLAEGWPIRVQDRPDSKDFEPRSLPDCSQTVAVHTGGLATSSTTARRWRRGGQEMHHLLDPKTGLPASSPWRTVSVAAPSCLAANIASTTAIIRGSAAANYLRDSGFAARLVDQQSNVTVLNGWPEP